MSKCIIELGTEELPPKALLNLSLAFTRELTQSLSDAGLPATEVESFATPRRLGILLRDVTLQQADQKIEKRGPALQAAFDADGNATKAANGFARGCGVAVSELQQKETDKGTWLYFEQNQPGQSLSDLLPDMISQALTRLPIPKRMRWGDRDDEFVRPVKWLLLKLDTEVIDCNILGLDSSSVSYGHRFHAPKAIEITEAADYEQALEKASVIASFEKRRQMIREQIIRVAAELGGEVNLDSALLDEVTGLVEWPVALSGKFDKEFLQVPTEALVSTMQDHQKYFAVFDNNGQLLPSFITIANIQSKQPQAVSHGNERVIRPRFADAMFFFEQDKKHPLADSSKKLEGIVFQKKLGMVSDKVNRVKQLANFIANQLQADQSETSRAAELCKCDLVSDMVGEFPKLQGIMGRYYALHDGETEEIADAIEQHYWPKFAGDELPKTAVSQSLALADRLDTLLGIFAIGQKPTGVKDPFALRRAALGVVRILIEKRLPLNLHDLCQQAANNLPDDLPGESAINEVMTYILDRLKAYYDDQNIRFDIVDAVLNSNIEMLYDSHQRILAVNEFQQNEAATALAAANKRISNILRKQNADINPEVNIDLLSETAEKELFRQLTELQQEVSVLFGNNQYLQGLNQLASLRPAVDQFFDDVMVMTEDEAIKNNRLALLKQLSDSFLQVADFSCIQS